MATSNPYQSPPAATTTRVQSKRPAHFRVLVRTAIVTLVFAGLGAILGPGCDAPAVPSAFVGAGLGAFLGLTTWRGILIIVGALVGVNVGVDVGAAGGDAMGFLGLGAGGFLGWLIGYVCRPTTPTR